MSPDEFLNQIEIIRKHLFSLASNFDKRQKFLNLLKHLKKNNIIDNKMAEDLYSLWQIRNKIASSPTFKIPDILEGTVKSLQRIKKNFDIK